MSIVTGISDGPSGDQRQSEAAKSGKSPKSVAHYPLGVRQALKLAALIEVGSLTMILPDGGRFTFEGSQPGPHGEMVIKDYAFAKRMAQGDIGVAESYIAKEWDAPDLTALLQMFAANQHVLARLLEGRPVVRFLQMLYHWMHRNTRSGAKRNIHAHYDLGNEFYRAWLDPSMTYSSGFDFDLDGDLQASQQRKNATLAADLGIAPQHSVLEIGCGWGGFAEYVASKIGAKVKGLTISTAQLDYARKRIADAGLSDKVDLELRDYRDERGSYDRIASIEMFEAVGESYWPAYFSQLRDCLKPDGLRRDGFVIGFPWQLAWMLKLLRILPYPLYFRLAERVGRAD